MSVPCRMSKETNKRPLPCLPLSKMHDTCSQSATISTDWSMDKNFVSSDTFLLPMASGYVFTSTLGAVLHFLSRPEIFSHLRTDERMKKAAQSQIGAVSIIYPTGVFDLGCGGQRNHYFF